MIGAGDPVVSHVNSVEVPWAIVIRSGVTFAVGKNPVDVSRIITSVVAVAVCPDIDAVQT